MERVWIYPCDRPLTTDEQAALSESLDAFTARWAAHKQKLTARYELPYGHFIVLKVNEADIQASGCSIDESVRFMREQESRFGLNLFDRHTLMYEKDGQIKRCTLNDIATRYAEGELTDETPVFYNGISTGRELETEWKQPFAKSGYFRFV